MGTWGNGEHTKKTKAWRAKALLALRPMTVLQQAAASRMALLQAARKAVPPSRAQTQGRERKSEAKRS